MRKKQLITYFFGDQKKLGLKFSISLSLKLCQLILKNLFSIPSIHVFYKITLLHFALIKNQSTKNQLKIKSEEKENFYIKEEEDS